MDVRPAEDVTAPLSTDVEPASERRDLESPVSEAITQQPEPQAAEAAEAADQVRRSAAVVCSEPSGF